MAIKGERIRHFFNSEARALNDLYLNIEALIPSTMVAGSAHPGEEGRYVESLVRSFLNRHLPAELKALSGFIVRPATKTGDGDLSRKNEEDAHSRQLDVIVYDVAHFPIYERFEEFAIVPPEGVVAIASIKKSLYEKEVADELRALSEAVYLCRHTNAKGKPVRGPNSALIAFTSKIKRVSVETQGDWIFNSISGISEGEPFDRLVGQIAVLNGYTIFKKKPKPQNEEIKTADYILFKHESDEMHLGLQFIMTGILSAYYDPTRSSHIGPGFTSFESNRNFR